MNTDGAEPTRSDAAPARRLAYISMETPRAGQASRTHIDEMVRGLGRFGWTTTLFATVDGGASSKAGVLARLIGYARVTVRAALALPQHDAVYVRSHVAAAPVALIAQLLGKPVFHEINGKSDDLAVTYRFLRPFAGFIDRIYRCQYRWATHLFVVTDGLVPWARAMSGHDRIKVVPNGANTALFTPDGPDAGLARPYVVFVGGLVAWHGIGTMLTALRDDAWPPGVGLVVVGDGIERTQLEAAHDTPGLIWLGRRPYAEIPAILRGALAALSVIEDQGGRADIGVAPMKLFEALACGIPVIASDLPFQADLVRNHDCGYVVSPRDPSQLAITVAHIAAKLDDARARGARGADYVKTHATWHHRAQQVAAIMAPA